MTTHPQTSVLVADDEANLRKVLVALLEREGYTARAVPDGPHALDVIRKGGVDILITDLKMPQMTGLELLEAAKSIDAGLPVIVITAHGSVDTAVSALKRGAQDYITKPFDKAELKLAVRKAAAVRAAADYPMLDPREKGQFRIVGRSRPIQQIFEVISKVAATPSTVLITGESGTGKELVAAALHENSDRAKAPFIRVNCAAIPKDLLESEFFGYEQGAFTGAVTSKPGRFELADGGTLFLDEIAEIPSAMQVKLLRALQESEFERVGGVQTKSVDVRLIAATNRDLEVETREGRFREDLYYRLNVVRLELPALRDRPDDIPLLVEHFVEKYNRRLQRDVAGFTPRALEILAGYPWPGNIRELENVIERTLLFAERESIDAEDLPDDLLRGRGATSETPAPLSTQLPSLSHGATSMKEIVRQATSQLERDLIIKALEETHGNVTRAAHLLRISRKGLQNKMKEFGLRDTENS